MGKLKSEFKKLIKDLKHKRFSGRVKLFVAGISSVAIVVAFMVLLALSQGKDKASNENAVSGEVSVAQENNKEETSDEENNNDTNTVSSETDSDAVLEDEHVLDETEDAGEEYINETLFLGDSNTVRMMNYGITSLDNTLAVVGMGIQSVKTLKCIQFAGYDAPITMVEAVKLLKPNRIIITFGTNNANGMSVDDFIKKYKEALAAIKEAEPDVDILINSIPPIAEKNSYPTLSQNSIDKFNNALIKMAAELSYKYIDSASVMKDDSNGYAKKGYTVSDGIHISEDGFAAMFTYIRTHSHVVRDTSPRPETPLPKQVKATYVVDSSGKMNNDPEAYKEMSEVTKAQQEALKKALEESAKKKQEEIIAKQNEQCQHTNYRKDILSEATENSEGKIRYTCNDCGYVKDEVIPKKKPESSSKVHEHSYSVINEVKAKPGVKGYRELKCDGCGNVKTEEIAALPVESTTTTPVTPETTTPGTSESETPGTTEPATPVVPEPTTPVEPAPGGTPTETPSQGDEGSNPSQGGSSEGDGSSGDSSQGGSSSGEDGAEGISVNDAQADEAE